MDRHAVSGFNTVAAAFIFNAVESHTTSGNSRVEADDPDVVSRETGQNSCYVSDWRVEADDPDSVC